MALSAHTIKTLGSALQDVDAAKSLETAISTLDTYVASLNAGSGPPTPAQSSNDTTISTTNFVNKITYSTGIYYATAGGF